MTRLEQLLDAGKDVLYRQAHVLVINRGGTIFSGSTDKNAQHVYDLASLSKLVTGTMVLDLAGRGRIDLDEPVLPQLGAGAGPRARALLEKATPAHLLAHRAGLPAWYPFYTATGSFWDRLETALAAGGAQAEVVYSDLGFMLLGLLAERASGRPLARNLAALNGLLNTAFCYNPEAPGACVPTECGNGIERSMCARLGLAFEGWRPDDVPIRGQANDGNAWYYWQGTAGHAGIFGAADDLAKLARLYLNDGRVGDLQLIPSPLVARSFQRLPGNRGLMWDLSDVFPNGAGHTGFTGTALWLCPPKSTATVLLASRLALPGPPNLTAWRRDCFAAVYEAL